MEKETLFETQKKLQQAFCSPELGKVNWAESCASVRVQPPVSVERRIDIYRNGYFVRLGDALRDDFPRLHAALGEENFRLLVPEFLAVHPSRHQNLGELGRPLAEFLESTSNGKRYPLLVDLTKIEWLALEAFWADEAGHQAKDIVGEEVKLRLHPSVRFFDSSFPLVKIWTGKLALSPKAVVRSKRWKRAEQGTFFVCRQEGVVYLRALEKFEAAFLRAVGAGLGMEAAGERSFAVWDGEEEEFAKTVQERLAKWVGEKVLLV